jgi:hypothetical protein
MLTWDATKPLPPPLAHLWCRVAKHYVYPRWSLYVPFNTNCSCLTIGLTSYIKLHFRNIVSLKESNSFPEHSINKTSYLSSWAIAKIAKHSIYPRVIQGIGLVILGNPYLGKSHQIMQYIHTVNISICIIWVQIEMQGGESTCLARKCHVGRPWTSLVRLPHRQLLASICVSYIQKIRTPNK